MLAVVVGEALRHPLHRLLGRALAGDAGGGEAGAEDRQADAGVAPEQLLEGERQGQAGGVAEHGVGEEVERVQADLGRLLHDRVRELLPLVPLVGGGPDDVLGEVVDPLLDRELVLVEARGRSRHGGHLGRRRDDGTSLLPDSNNGPAEVQPASSGARATFRQARRARSPACAGRRTPPRPPRSPPRRGTGPAGPTCWNRARRRQPGRRRGPARRPTAGRRAHGLAGRGVDPAGQRPRTRVGVTRPWPTVSTTRGRAQRRPIPPTVARGQRGAGRPPFSSRPVRTATASPGAGTIGPHQPAPAPRR